MAATSPSPFEKANSWDGSGFARSTQLSLMAVLTAPRLARSAFQSAIWPIAKRMNSRGRRSGWFSSRSTCRLSSVSSPDYTPPRARRALILLKLLATSNSWLLGEPQQRMNTAHVSVLPNQRRTASFIGNLMRLWRSSWHENEVAPEGRRSSRPTK